MTRGSWPVFSVGWLIWLGCLLTSGCSSAWIDSYNLAEQVARSRETDLVLFYKDHLDPQSGQMAERLEDPRVHSALTGKVKCVLVTVFEPNAKFVAQYGVSGAPALIVVHPDQTYHAREGPMSVEQIVDFLHSAQAPGEKPELNPQLPREYQYQWIGIYEDALERARRQNRKLLIVYKWWLSGESNELLRRLSKPEVARHVHEMAHCLLDWDYVPNRRHMASYGVQKVPAMVIVHQDGTYHAKEGLPDIADIVRFIVNARAPGQLPGWRARADVRAAYRWYADFDRAAVVARRQDKSLFVFYYSTFSDESNRMEQLLGQTETAALFTDTVNCKLDWAIRGNRELVKAYGVDRVPAFIIVRPDGTYHTRVGSVGTVDLVNLFREAERAGRTPTPATQGG
jgi:hypothetical protein